MSPRNLRLAVVTLAAACVRVLWCFAPSATFGDALEYQRIAAWLTTRHLFSIDGIAPSSYRPPLYPALIAALDVLTHHPIPALIAVQMVLSTLTVVLVVLVATQQFGDTAGVIAGVILAFAPMTARFSTLVLTETVFTFLVVAGVWGWMRGQPVRAGLAFGLAVLTRASALPYVLALGVYGLLGRRERARGEVLALSLVALLTVAPWAARNLIQVHRLTIADAGWGANLFYGGIDLRKGSNRWAQLAEAQDQLKSDPAAGSGESGAARIAMSRIVADPLGWIRIRISQWPWLLVDTGDYLPVAANQVSFRDAIATRHLATIAVKLGFLAGNSLVLLLAAVGAWSCRGRLIETLPLWSFPAYLMAAHLPVFVEPRYGLPLVPFVAIFAGEGVRRLLANRAILAA